MTPPTRRAEMLAWYDEELARQREADEDSDEECREFLASIVDGEPSCSS
jgi:hypothetical protein